MKKRLSLLSYLLVLAMAVMAQTKVEVDGIYYNLDSSNNTAEVTSGNSKYRKDFVIPASISVYGATYSVTTIGNSAFAYCDSLTSIVIPNSVTTIGNYAFYECRSLTSIVIPNSVTTIGKEAFCCCYSLTSIEISNSVTTIGEETFSDCTSLKSIEIPNSVTTIGSSAFYKCRSLTSIVIPNSVTIIGNYAFSNCRSLTSIEIPNSVTTIKEGTFAGCESLKSIVIPNSVTTIEEGAFRACSNLTSIEIPNSVTTIGQYAFFKCAGLTSIVIPNSVTTIEDRTFYDCRSLTSIEIPNSVTTIGNYAFYGCSGLTSIEIPNSVTTIIGYYAFYGIKIVINLSKVYVDNAPEQKVINAPNGFIADNFVLGEVEKLETLVGYIGEESYIRLPKSYQEKKYVVGEKAFEGYLNMTDLDIPENVKLLSDRAFYGCENLTNMYIGSGVKMIGNKTFSGCNNLEKIYMMGSVPPTVGSENFTFTQYVGVELYVPKGSLAAYQAADTWKEFWEIKEFDTTGIDAITVEETIQAERAGNGIKLKNAVGKQVAVYDAKGTLVSKYTKYSGEVIVLGKGTYIVVAGQKAIKVML